MPPLPHSTSSESGQAEAIQAEVRKAQSELQGRVASLMEENQMLGQVAASGEGSLEGPGPFPGRGSWLSGLRRNLMGLVQRLQGRPQQSQRRSMKGGK